MYLVYLAEDAAKELQTKSELEIDQISRRIELLGEGRWQNGTRVKKLQSVNKQRAIYEARIDDGRRMLFTLKAIESAQAQTGIFVFHLSVEHDKVIRFAQNILGEDYSFDLYKKAKEEELEFEELVKTEKNYWPKQTAFHYYLDAIRFYELNNDDFIRFMNKPVSGPDELWNFRLRLTKEQMEILKLQPPLLLAGTAGSGKTTIIVHKLLNEPYINKIYLTQSDQLSKDAQRMFDSLIVGYDQEAESRSRTQFTTFRAFLREYQEDQSIPVLNKDQFISIYSEYAKVRGLEKKFPPLMVWEEIRGVWKSGLFTKIGQELMLQEYLALSSKQAPNFRQSRTEAYKIFEWYREYLKKNNLQDELDIILSTIENVKRIKKTYDLVVCDEVQDLTNLHIQLLFALANGNPNCLILAGDDHQVVHHSGFRWENVKQSFYIQCEVKPNVCPLTRNFRNTGHIVKLANSINRLQENLTEFRYQTRGEESASTGHMPELYLDMAENELLDIVAQAGPTQAVLVRDKETQESILEYCRNKFNKVPLVFTIPQAKGLEFEGVILWKLTPPESENNKEWINILRKGVSDKWRDQTERFIRYEASLLYVAITRGMKHCSIYDGQKPSIIWQFKDISKCVTPINTLTDVEAFWRVPANVEDWYNQGVYLFRKGLFQQAIDCIGRVDDPALNDQVALLRAKCQAYQMRDAGNFIDAAEIFLNLGVRNEAADIYDQAGMYKEAADLFRYSRFGKKDYPRERTYRYRQYDQEGKWKEAAMFYMLDKRFIEAATRFERIEDWKNAELAYRRLGDNLNSERCRSKHMRQ